MDPALKQRLLGAAVLLALLVIFVPMFFPGPAEREPAPTVDLDIPPQPADTLDSRVFELDVPDQDQPAPPSDGLDSGLPPAVAASGTSEPVPAEAPPAAAATAPEQSSAPAKAAPVKAPVADEPGTAAATRFAVSVGVFASDANADTRLAQVKLLGYPAYVEAIDADGKAARGVRVGPFDGRAAAEAARLRLTSQLPDTKPALVALGGSRTRDVPAAAVNPDAATGWAVQLAAFRDRADAEKLRGTVRKAGFEAFVDQTRDAKGRWWRVRVGPRTQRADAETLRAAIKSKTGRSGLVVTHP